jgi:gamma-glutamyltranspeptidase/glutathione hydrolase
LLQSLALLKHFDLGAMDPAGDEYIHTIVEAIKLAFIDRDIYYGDPDFADIPTETLLSDGYNDKRRKLISAQASDKFRPGDIAGDEPARLDALLALAGSETGMPFGAGEPTFADIPEIEGDTVHLDCADRWGNMVSATPSGGWLQSSPALPGLGFNLPTRAQMFWLDDTLPSGLAPGKRPRTTLTPSLVTRDGSPWLAFGSPGGDQQDQWQLCYLLRILHHKMNLQAAIDAPLFNSRHLIASFFPRAAETRTLMIEDRVPETVRKALARRGHDLNVQDAWSLGRLCAVARGRQGQLRAAATPRFMQAYAAGR